MKKTVLRSYAKLIAACGVNIQKGQEVFIQAELDQPEFVTMLVEECYKLKAKKVVVDWSHQPIDKLHVRYRSLTTMSKLDNYEQARWQHYVDTIPCRIYLISEDPDGLKGVNQEKMAKAQQKKYPIIKGYRDQIENKYQWCIAAVPGEKWATKLFRTCAPARQSKSSGRRFLRPPASRKTPLPRGRRTIRICTTGARTSTACTSASFITRHPTARIFMSA